MSWVAKCFTAFGKNFEFLTGKEIRLFFIGSTILLLIVFLSPARLLVFFGWPDVRTPAEKWFEHAKARSGYCGKFGQYTYDFPKNIVEWTIKYEGEPSWGGERDWKIKGCTDRFEGVSFDFRLPDGLIVQQPNNLDASIVLGVHVFQDNNSNFIREMVRHYRRFKVGGEVPDNFDIKVGLHYFDTKNTVLSRVFWHFDKGSEDDVYVSCSIGAAVPQCSVHLASSGPGAGVSIYMAMDHLPDWKRIKNRIEAQLSSYRVFPKEGVGK